MPRIRTAGHLQASLDGELGWRVVELGTLRAALVAAAEPRRTALIRACVPIVYAHWEGFIKKAATNYGLYLNSRGLTYRELKPCFLGVAAFGIVSQLHRIERKISTASKLSAELLVMEETAVDIDLWPRLMDVGNLNFDLFMEIVEFLNLPHSHYSTKRAFIDETLVASRNKVAHGERPLVDLMAIQNTISETVDLLNIFKADIEDAVSTASFRR